MKRRFRAPVLLAALALALFSSGVGLAGHLQSPLDDPARPDTDTERDGGSRPLEVYSWLGIVEGMTVADLVPGSGYNCHILARVVGPEGTVVCAYTDEEGAAALKERLEGAGLDNFEVYESLSEAPDRTMDAAILVRNLHDMFIPWEVETYGLDPNVILGDVLRTLKSGGLLGIIDARTDDGLDEENHRISENMVIRELEARGFEFVERSDLLANPHDEINAPSWGKRWNIDRLLMKFRRPTS